MQTPLVRICARSYYDGNKQVKCIADPQRTQQGFVHGVGAIGHNGSSSTPGVDWGTAYIAEAANMLNYRWFKAAEGLWGMKWQSGHACLAAWFRHTVSRTRCSLQCSMPSTAVMGCGAVTVIAGVAAGGAALSQTSHGAGSWSKQWSDCEARPPVRNPRLCDVRNSSRCSRRGFP